MENSKEEEEIADRLLKEKYLNEKNNNLLELAKNINLYSNQNLKNDDIIKDIKIKNNIFNNKDLSLFEKMSILEENNKSLKQTESNNKDINTINNESNINNTIIKEHFESILLKNICESNEIIKLNFLCGIHHNKKFDSYCITCNKNICNDCIEYTDIHKEHNIIIFSNFILKIPEEEIKYRLYSSQKSLRYLKQLLLNICSELIDINEIILKNKVKKAYIKYYKQNLYQIKYANFLYLRYIFQKKFSLFNYQVLENIYQIKFNNVIFPDTSKDIKERANLFIQFLSRNENYILLSNNSEIFERINLINQNNNLNNLNEIKDNNIIHVDNENNEITYKQKNITNKIITNTIENEIFLNKINETKITTSIFLKSDNSKSLIGKKKEKIIKKFTKKKLTHRLYNKKSEKINKEIGEHLFFEYSNFIENHPPLDDGIEVEFHKEIKFMYKDKIKNKIIYSLYQGECQKGTQIRHGRGFFKWGDGEKYIGYWSNNKREGHGINFYNNGNVYKGLYKNGKKEGKGRYEWKNGDIYEGEWKNGVKEGEGIYYCSNGDYYKGLFVNDKINGQGIYTWKNEDQYKGGFKNNYIEGEGVLYKKINKKEENSSIKESFKIYTKEKSLINIIK